MRTTPFTPDRPTLAAAPRFTRHKTHTKFEVLATPEREITGRSAARHTARQLLKTGKDGERTPYILKHLSGRNVIFDAALETYSAWIFRLHVLDGARIPKYSRYGFDGAVVSQEILGMESLASLSEDLPESEFVPNFLEKIRSADSNNLRAFAQIMVCTIVFAENDLKYDHLVFDRDGHLTRFDFDQSFYVDPESGALDFDAKDFENLPCVSGSFKPYNFAFNHAGGEVDPEYREEGRVIAQALGAEFKREVNIALLKILLMPDFLLAELRAELSSHGRRISDKKFELAEEKKAKLLGCMLKSESFKEFLRVDGEAAKLSILAEVSAFRSNNSHFRKKWTDDSGIRESIERDYSAIRAAFGLVVRSVSSVSSETDSVDSQSGQPRFKSAAQGRRERKLINSDLKTFLQTQITRLRSCRFTRGVKDKVALLEAIVAKLDGADLTSKEQLHSEAAMVMHHRRSRSSHLFTNSSSNSWKEWQAYCKQNQIATSDRPEINLSREKKLKNYNEYRRSSLKP